VDYIKAICDEVENIFASESTVVRLRAPVKIYGDIYGQYVDMLRLFDMWGAPSETVGEGDIESFDYLFLGDYVDRGNHSLEVICLLFSLKIKHPESVFLLRGHHEDINVNMHGGFAEECRMRLNDNPSDPNSVFATVNRVFNYLPLAAILEERILCVHGGIGNTLRSIDELEYIQRPIEVEQSSTNPTQQILSEILWSDPTPSETDTDISMARPRREGVLKFGVNRLHTFLAENHLNMIIRSHETVMEGFDRYAGGELITVTSCTDYCG
jgi:diadenosine tetraphosphatase ApaH/serine/threonine PP2A family protein phosphatase